MPSPTQAAAEFVARGKPGLLVLQVGAEAPARRLEEDVLHGLSDAGQRSISPTWLYDRRGSEIYEEITVLEEYYPTRTEADMLRKLAPALCERVSAAPIVELGSGSSTKSRILLDAWTARRPDALYVPIDVSGDMLEASARSLCKAYPRLSVLALAGEYGDALAALPPASERLLMFLGSTIGNFAPDAQQSFFANLGERMEPGQHLLLGFDRRAHAGKPASVIHAAYDDARGVTARFSLNLLVRINRELDADFDLDRWRHVTLYAKEQHRIEIYLESAANQEVRIGALDRSFKFEKGERILAEYSRKFDPDELAGWCDERGFTPVETWTDEKEWFGLLLLRWAGT